MAFWCSWPWCESTSSWRVASYGWGQPAEVSSSFYRFHWCCCWPVSWLRFLTLFIDFAITGMINHWDDLITVMFVSTSNPPTSWPTGPQKVSSSFLRFTPSTWRTPPTCWSWCRGPLLGRQVFYEGIAVTFRFFLCLTWRKTPGGINPGLVFRRTQALLLLNLYLYWPRVVAAEAPCAVGEASAEVEGDDVLVTETI